ncbi:MAG: electron transport complex subunit RsxG [Gammaproteobacteria bacterium]|nr:electron transport complex subunit RsxG [Gammaproteobacteria bacterium]
MADVSARRGLATILAAALVAGLLVSFSDNLSRDRIAENERRFLLRSLTEVVTPDLYDNDLPNSRFQVEDAALLGVEGPTDVYVGTRAGEPAVFIFFVNAPDGYNGGIRLLVGITGNGTVTGVRVISHRETPGLGDAIEIKRSNWIMGFSGRSLANPAPEGWRVRVDGGQFDQLTGATITPRAVVKAIRNTLTFFAENRDRLFKMPVHEKS